MGARASCRGNAFRPTHTTQALVVVVFWRVLRGTPSRVSIVIRTSGYSSN